MTKFNAQQQEAIDFYKGACGVVASAGSGKSTVLLNRIDNLVEKHDIDQGDILAITFTNKTATELRSKLKKMGLSQVEVGTFHAVCLQIMFKEGIDVRGKLVPEWKVESWFKEIEEKPDMQDIMGYIGYQKNYMISYDGVFEYKDSNYTELELREFYKMYEENKKAEGLFDFDDYLIMTLEILQKNKGKYAWDFVLVDEHQDSNKVQNKLLLEFCQSGNIFAVFDPKQAIYSFRAGNIEYCTNFEKYWDNAKIINMYMNYRSTNNIVNMSNGFIKPYFENYSHYVDSEAFNKNDGDITIDAYVDEVDEAVGVVTKIKEMLDNGVEPSQIAVLYRLNAQSVYIENELKNHDIEYDITNNASFFKRKEVDAIVNILRLVMNPHDDGALETVFNFRTHPLKYFSNQLFGKVRRVSGMNNISLFESLTQTNFDKAWQNTNAEIFVESINKLRLQNDKGVKVYSLIDNIVKIFNIDTYIEEKYNNQEEIDERKRSIEILKSFVKNNNLEQFINFVYSANTKKKTKDNVVKLMTAHASKGLEWDNTFVVGIKDGKFPHERADELEEARLFYVAMTRAKKNLYVSQIGNSNSFIRQYFEGVNPNEEKEALANLFGLKPDPRK